MVFSQSIVISHSFVLAVKNLPLKKRIVMITKKQLTVTLEKLPEEFSIEDLIDKLILLGKIERAEKESKRGETIAEAELEKEIEKWFK
jgi:methyl coenzyme M reductase subunit C-like uncharacterized protein (methanogenesis marker protein 7)